MMVTINSPKSHPIITTLIPRKSSQADHNKTTTWDISLGDREPPALMITTNYQFQTKSLALFPVFATGDQVIYKISDFFSQIVVKRNYPELIHLQYSPVQGLNVDTVFWVPSPNTLRCLLQITNSTLSGINLSVGFTVLLNPLEGGFRMRETSNQNTNILLGASGSQHFTFGTKGPIAPNVMPYTSLNRQLRLESGSIQTIPWVLTASQSDSSAINNLQEDLNFAPWEQELAAVDNTYCDIIKIETGNDEWDIAFEQTQKYFPVLVQNNIISTFERTAIDKPEADNKTSQNSTSEISIYDLYYLIYNYHIPYREIARKLLGFIIDAAQQYNTIPCKFPVIKATDVVPSPPIMAKLVKKLYSSKVITDELRNILLPHLVRNIDYWLSKIINNSGNWDSSDQIALNNLSYPPTNNRYIKTFISPILYAMLYTDIIALQSLSSLDESPPEILESSSRHLEYIRQQFLKHWSVEDLSFCYSDQETLQTPKRSKRLYQGRVDNPLILNKRLPSPNRIAVYIESEDVLPHKVAVTVNGINIDGKRRTEKLVTEQLFARQNRIHLVSGELYVIIEQLNIEGVENSQVEIWTLDYTMYDISQFLALQTNLIPSKERNSYIVQKLKNDSSFWYPYGITLMDSSRSKIIENNYIDIKYNDLVMESLIACNETQSASEIFAKLMNAITLNLSSSHQLYEMFVPESGQGIGKTNTPLGLPPLGRFLDIIGINLIDEKTIDIYGRNPYPWDITVTFRGTKVNKVKSRAKVIFPGGQTILIKSPKRKRVLLD